MNADPYFQPQFIVIPKDVKNKLTTIHKNYLQSFGITLTWIKYYLLLFKIYY